MVEVEGDAGNRHSAPRGDRAVPYFLAGVAAVADLEGANSRGV